jgi:AbrB family looped-hinge helix DNA binding protein
MAYLSSMAEVVSVDKAGRIVIPKAVRDAAGVDERAKLLIAATEKGRVVLQKLDIESLTERLEKELAGKDIDAMVRKVREEIRARIQKDYPDLVA